MELTTQNTIDTVKETHSVELFSQAKTNRELTRTITTTATPNNHCHRQESTALNRDVRVRGSVDVKN